MYDQAKYPLSLTVFCGVLLSTIFIGMPHSAADDANSQRPESKRPESKRSESISDGDGERARNSLRDGDRFRAFRDRMQPGRPDGAFQGRSEGGFRGRPDGGFQGRPGGGAPGGAAAIPMFRALDRDGDGRIDGSELDMAIASLRTLDTNNDGELTTQELFARGPEQMGMGRPGMGQRFGMEDGAENPGRRPDGNRPGAAGQLQPLAAMMKQFDRNGDGAISKEEAPERMAENFDRVDQNGDGKISEDELDVIRQRMSSMGQRDRRAQPPSDPAGGTRPRRPDPEE